MKLKIANNKYWIKDGIELPLNFESMDDYEKFNYIYHNNLLHKEDGPAVILSNGTKCWYLNGKRHRIEGPAIIWSYWTDEFIDGDEWWLNGFWLDGKIYQKIQNSSKEELLVYMINPEYKDYLPLVEYRLNQ